MQSCKNQQGIAIIIVIAIMVALIMIVTALLGTVTRSGDIAKSYKTGDMLELAVLTGKSYALQNAPRFAKRFGEGTFFLNDEYVCKFSDPSVNSNADLTEITENKKKFTVGESFSNLGLTPIMYYDQNLQPLVYKTRPDSSVINDAFYTVGLTFRVLDLSSCLPTNLKTTGSSSNNRINVENANKSCRVISDILNSKIFSSDGVLSSDIIFANDWDTGNGSYPYPFLENATQHAYSASSDIHNRLKSDYISGSTFDIDPLNIITPRPIQWWKNCSQWKTPIWLPRKQCSGMGLITYGAPYMLLPYQVSTTEFPNPQIVNENDIYTKYAYFDNNGSDNEFGYKQYYGTFTDSNDLKKIVSINNPSTANYKSGSGFVSMPLAIRKITDDTSSINGGNGNTIAHTFDSAGSRVYPNNPQGSGLLFTPFFKTKSYDYTNDCSNPDYGGEYNVKVGSAPMWLLAKMLEKIHKNNPSIDYTSPACLIKCTLNGQERYISPGHPKLGYKDCVLIELVKTKQIMEGEEGAQTPKSGVKQLDGDWTSCDPKQYIVDINGIYKNNNVDDKVIFTINNDNILKDGSSNAAITPANIKKETEIPEKDFVGIIRRKSKTTPKRFNELLSLNQLREIGYWINNGEEKRTRKDGISYNVPFPPREIKYGRNFSHPEQQISTSNSNAYNTRYLHQIKAMQYVYHPENIGCTVAKQNIFSPTKAVAADINLAENLKNQPSISGKNGKRILADTTNFGIYAVNSANSFAKNDSDNSKFKNFDRSIFMDYRLFDMPQFRHLNRNNKNSIQTLRFTVRDGFVHPSESSISQPTPYRWLFKDNTPYIFGTGKKISDFAGNTTKDNESLDHYFSDISTVDDSGNRMTINVNQWTNTGEIDGKKAYKILDTFSSHTIKQRGERGGYQRDIWDSGNSQAINDDTKTENIVIIAPKESIEGSYETIKTSLSSMNNLYKDKNTGEGLTSPADATVVLDPSTQFFRNAAIELLMLHLMGTEGTYPNDTSEYQSGDQYFPHKHFVYALNAFGEDYKTLADGHKFAVNDDSNHEITEQYAQYSSSDPETIDINIIKRTRINTLKYLGILRHAIVKSSADTESSPYEENKYDYSEMIEDYIGNEGEKSLTGQLSGDQNDLFRIFIYAALGDVNKDTIVGTRSLEVVYDRTAKRVLYSRWFDPE